MTLKIERIAGKRRTWIRLSGAFRSEHLDQVKAEIERGGPRVVLDLEEVDLVDVEGVRFLNACEAKGVSILRCSPYIREWMLQERGRREGVRHRKSNDPRGSLPQRRMVMNQHVKNVVLVHGAFADGSGWEAVANILKNDGYKVSVAQPPETSYADDQKYTKAAIDAMGGPVVLVG